MKNNMNLLDLVFSTIIIVSFFFLPSLGNSYNQEWSLYKDFILRFSELFGDYGSRISNKISRFSEIFLVVPVIISVIIILNSLLFKNLSIVKLLKIIGVISFGLSFIFLGYKISSVFQIKYGLVLFVASNVYFLATIFSNGKLRPKD